MAYQSPYMMDPPKTHDPHNNPQVNACGRINEPADFVYCNFNKHLKFTPEIFHLWLKTLQKVNNSMLCLLENPVEAIPHILTFVEKFDPSLVNRVRFQGTCERCGVCECLTRLRCSVSEQSL